MTSILIIDGMHAVHAVRAVFAALGGVPGVDRAHVTMGRAEVDHAAPVDATAFAVALELAGCALREVRVERRLHISDEGRAPSAEE